jgi:hypothetical protein
MLVDVDWSHLASRFEGLTVVIFGTSVEAVVYTTTQRRILSLSS